LAELANTTSSVNGNTKKRFIVQARAASPSILEAFTHFLNGGAHCGSKQAQWRCRAYFSKGSIRHDIPEEPARRDMARVPLLFLDGGVRDLFVTFFLKRRMSPALTQG